MMSLMQRRREMMSSRIWDYEFVFDDQGSAGELFDVIKGQVIQVAWDCPNGNKNGWVLNGSGFCENIRRLLEVGNVGSRIVTVASSGTVRIGSYANSRTFAVRFGVIRIKYL